MGIFTDYIRLVNDLTEKSSSKTQEKEYDIDDLKDTVNELKDNPIFSLFADMFGIDANEFADEVMSRLEQSQNEKTEEHKFSRPSETINTEAGLQIHKLVQEYIDTMVKPFNVDGKLSDMQINDAYAGLYEFACWLYQK